MDIKVKIGVVSDTHDNLPKIKKIVKFFNKKKVNFVIHAGDYIAPFSVKPWISLKSPFIGVFGNNDGEKKGLLNASGDKIKESPYTLTINNKKILVVHDIDTLKKFPKKFNYDLLIYGHTHKPRIKRIKKTLLVNPGEGGGWLTKKPSVAVMDLNKLTGKIFKI